MDKPLTIATICAREGSEGLPGKNIKPLLGKPLIGYSIEQALASKSIDRVFVSTDSQAIADVALSMGAEVPFMRPESMATSDAPKLPVIKHLVEWVESNVAEVGVIVDLDPTSPLREVTDIDACFDLLNEQTDAVITAYEAEKNPYFNMFELNKDGLAKLSKIPEGDVVTRQHAPKVYAMNASIYCWHRDTLELGLWSGRTRAHVMPREKSIDIDHWVDFCLVELLLKRRTLKP